MKIFQNTNRTKSLHSLLQPHRWHECCQTITLIALIVRPQTLSSNRCDFVNGAELIISQLYNQSKTLRKWFSLIRAESHAKFSRYCCVNSGLSRVLQPTEWYVVFMVEQSVFLVMASVSCGSSRASVPVLLPGFAQNLMLLGLFFWTEKISLVCFEW